MASRGKAAALCRHLRGRIRRQRRPNVRLDCEFLATSIDGADHPRPLSRVESCAPLREPKTGRPSERYAKPHLQRRLAPRVIQLEPGWPSKRRARRSIQRKGSAFPCPSPVAQSLRRTERADSGGGRVALIGCRSACGWKPTSHNFFTQRYRPRAAHRIGDTHAAVTGDPRADGCVGSALGCRPAPAIPCGEAPALASSEGCALALARLPDRRGSPARASMRFCDLLALAKRENTFSPILRWHRAIEIR